MSTCPACQESDQVRRISAIISEGSSNTVGSARTKGAAIRSDGKVTLSRGRTQMSSATTSNLVARFWPGTAPRNLDWLGFVAAFVVLWVCGLLGGADSSAGTWISIVLAGAGALATYLGVRRLQAGARWIRDEAERRIGGGYYCFRDDMAFGQDVPAGDTPERYSARCRRAAAAV